MFMGPWRMLSQRRLHTLTPLAAMLTATLRRTARMLVLRQSMVRVRPPRAIRSWPRPRRSTPRGNRLPMRPTNTAKAGTVKAVTVKADHAGSDHGAESHGHEDAHHGPFKPPIKDPEYAAYLDELAVKYDNPKDAGLYFSVYYCMTGLHAIHVVAGIVVILWILVRALKEHFHSDFFGPVDYVGLYWHLVDLVWIFLFPMLYLVR